MNKKDGDKELKRYAEEIKEYCKKHKRCNTRCVFYDINLQCILQDRSPQEWEAGKS